MTPKLPLARRKEGVELALKVTPKAGKATIEGVVVDAAGAPWLAVKVTAPPDGGKANEAVLTLLAKRLGVPAPAIRLVAGATARWKRVAIAGDPEELERRLLALLPGSD
ncbi:DUF167 family protein [Benzoatithermus flavus]|uniref:UPF0235 protein U1T56_23515 n=1 Tax=Benzoatithermus flavus TaxID=3108223 RepID=A0ABU8XY35_9PROT